MELAVPLLAFPRQGGLHVVAAEDVLERMLIHFPDQCAERLREQVQFLPLPAFSLLDVFRFAGERRKRTRCATDEGIEHAARVVATGDLFEDFAEVGGRLRAHARPPATASPS